MQTVFDLPMTAHRVLDLLGAAGQAIPVSGSPATGATTALTTIDTIAGSLEAAGLLRERFRSAAIASLPTVRPLSARPQFAASSIG
jgi:hypothetical protein